MFFQDTKKIFSEFSRTEAVAEIEDTDLGLCLSQRLCQLMGEKNHVTSEYRKGSTFSAVLPIKAEADKAA